MGIKDLTAERPVADPVGDLLKSLPKASSQQLDQALRALDPMKRTRTNKRAFLWSDSEIAAHCCDDGHAISEFSVRRWRKTNVHR